MDPTTNFILVKKIHLELDLLFFHDYSGSQRLSGIFGTHCLDGRYGHTKKREPLKHMAFALQKRPCINIHLIMPPPSLKRAIGISKILV